MWTSTQHQWTCAWKTMSAQRSHETNVSATLFSWPIRNEMIVLYSGDTIRQSSVSTEKEWWRSNPHHTDENYNCSDVKSSETQSRSHRCTNQCFMISRTRILHKPFRIFHSAPMFFWSPVGPLAISVFGLKPGPVFPTKDTERPMLLPLIIVLHNHVVLIRWCIMRHPWRQCGPWWQLCVWQRRHWWRRLC